MREYEKYVCHLESLASEAMKDQGNEINTEQVALALDGGPSQILRQTITLERRKKDGAFFTSRNLANELTKYFRDDSLASTNKIQFLDPCCGVGDLLMACARTLPVSSDLKSTLSAWGKQLIGYDIHPIFIRATKARLLLTALLRGVQINGRGIPSLDNLFPAIKVGDGLYQPGAVRISNAILMNPPYSLTRLSEKRTWAGGKISMAALFLEACVVNARSNSQVIAILPDVLRSGSRYKKWREHISERAHINDIKIFGQFDRLTDIDVFILHLTVKPSAYSGESGNRKWEVAQKTMPRTVGDFFDVNVGPVVPYRDPMKGSWQPYIYPRIISPWDCVNHVQQHRRYNGRVFSPPFVVVRRTSRPGDKNRAAGSLINIEKPVAVENHFLVLKPKNENIKKCEQLITKLKSDKTNKWLNDRIRCRHLTVDALKELPWWSSTE